MVSKYVCVSVWSLAWGAGVWWSENHRTTAADCTRPLSNHQLNTHTLTPISHVLYMSSVCVCECVKMFSFCNEQLTDGNSLTWCKCKNKTEQFKDSDNNNNNNSWGQQQNSGQVYQRVIFYVLRLNVLVWTYYCECEREQSEKKQSCWEKRKKQRKMNVQTVNCVYCLVLGFCSPFY